MLCSVECESNLLVSGWNNKSKWFAENRPICRKTSFKCIVICYVWHFVFVKFVNRLLLLVWTVFLFWLVENENSENFHNCIDISTSWICYVERDTTSFGILIASPLILCHTSSISIFWAPNLLKCLVEFLFGIFVICYLFCWFVILLLPMFAALGHIPLLLPMTFSRPFFSLSQHWLIVFPKKKCCENWKKNSKFLEKFQYFDQRATRSNAHIWNSFTLEINPRE